MSTKPSRRERLDSAVQSLLGEQNVIDYLKFSQSFHHYSLHNRLLIWAQNPEATLVKGFVAWKQHNRFVRKGEKGIGIYRPNPYKTGKQIITPDGVTDEKEMRFKWTYVFDVIQTEGEALPDAPEVHWFTTDGATDAFKTMLQTCESQFNVPVKFESMTGRMGYYQTNSHFIALNQERSGDGDQGLATLTHELGHALTPDLKTHTPAELEIIAETVAFLTCDYMGLDIGPQAYPYIVRYCTDRDILIPSLEKGQRIADQVIAALTPQEDAIAA